jgi:hypothetical protein
MCFLPGGSKHGLVNQGDGSFSCAWLIGAGPGCWAGRWSWR